jgi:hypothetical protein
MDTTRISIAAAFVTLVAGACVFDWDKLDPNESSSSVTGGAVCTPGEAVPCYGGPMGTENVGPCRGGTSTCNEEGSAFGPCEGEVAPVPEDCNTPADDDCDGEANEVEEGCSCTPGELRVCYDGPMGTSGVGACVSGQKLCLPSGNEFTPCYGQTVPIVEECAFPADDDCDGTPNEGCTVWALGYEADSHALARALDIAGNDDVVTAGGAYGVIDFGGGLIGGAGDYDVAVLRVTSGGAYVWANIWGDAAYQNALAVAVDGSGNIYVAGEFDGTLDFGVGAPLVSAGSLDAFILKLDAQGDPVWARQFGDASFQTVYAIDADPAGNVVVTGAFEGAISIDAFQPIADGRDGYVLKMDPGGNVVWGHAFGGAGWAEGLGVAFAGSDALVAGYFDDEVSFGGAPASAGDSDDGFVARLSSDGGQIWIATVGGPTGSQYITDVASGLGDIVAVSGGFDSAITLPASSVAAVEEEDAFVLAFDGAGNPVWGRAFGGTASQEATRIDLDGAGNVWVGVEQQSIVDYGAGPIASWGIGDVVMVKLDPTGALVRSVRLGFPDNEDVRGLGVDSGGNAVSAGHAEEEVDFGTGLVDCDGGWWIAKLPP